MLLRVATLLALPLVLLAGTARADDVFEVCKGESKTAVTGKGRPSLAIVYPDDFPIETTPRSRNAVGARLAVAEKAKIVPAKDVEWAKQLVGEKKWKENTAACGFAPSLVAVLGQRHPNLMTARASVGCEGSKCELYLDVERHGRPTAQRWVRYAAPLEGPKDQLATHLRAAKKLVARGVPPDAPTEGLAVSKLEIGKVRVRSDVDGALEADRIMEASAAFASCAIKGRKPHDVRGYWAQWTLSARGTAYQVMVKPFSGRDPKDDQAAACLRKALERTQMTCPRDARPVKVKTAICL